MSNKRKIIQQQEIKIPEICFKYRTAEQQISSESATATPLIKIEWRPGVGILQYLKGGEYPMKSLTSVETMWALNIAKRNFVEGMRFLSKPYFYPGYAIIALLPWKYKKKFIEQSLHSYCEISWRPVSEFLLKEEYMTSVAKELAWFIYTFLDNLGVNRDICDKFSEVVSACIDYDNAYRYRLEDIFSETTKTQLIKNPTKEIKRLLEILKFREYYTAADGRKSVSKNVFSKFNMLGTLLRVGLLHPKINRAFKVAVSEIDVRQMGYDEADRYWVCLREDYEFMGKTKAERKELIKDKNQPELIKIQ